ncbi:MAG TPA: class I SAM-dependent methyltransferase [Thermoplasmata archaeon]|nr:class I SAM-dependent methyltransferase [Thermoplasmata archaeon]
MARRPPAVSRMYREMARYYDAIYGEKDYAREVRHLRRMVRRWGPRPSRDWLDVACGTGRHLELLRRSFRVEGVDASASMLRIARRRLPDVRLVRGDMRSFDLGERFDVVSCLFSAIGYLRSARDLDRAFRAFARHLRPGGLLLVEPWLAPDQFRPHHVSLNVSRTADGFVVRAGQGRRRGRRSMIDFDYLIGIEGAGVRHRHETETLRLSRPAELVVSARRAGLAARVVAGERGRPGARGWIVARAPPER